MISGQQERKVLLPLSHGVFAPKGDLGTTHDWEGTNRQGRGSLVHHGTGGAAGAQKGDVASWGGRPLLGSLPTLAGVPPHGADLHHGGPAPAQPLLDGQLRWGHTVSSGPRCESHGSPREFPQSSPTSSSTRHHSTGTRTCYRGTPGREGDTHMPEQAPLPALGQPGRRESGERGRHGRGETR